MKTRSFVAGGRWLCLLLLMALLAGCGGGNGMPGAGRGKGSVALTMLWPETTTRLIPVASQSIRVQLFRAGNSNPVATQVLTRPAGGGQSNFVFNGIEVGDYTMVAAAFPNPDATGVPQAQGSIPVTIVAGQTVQIRLTMSSTIDRFDVAPTGPSVFTGDTVTLAGTLRDAQGNVVLVSPATVKWRSENSAVATVDENTGVVTGGSLGTARIIGRETESGKEGAATVTVRARPQPGTGPIWPRFHGDYRNSGFVIAPAINNPREVFRSPVGGNIGASPAIGADGTVYVTGSGTLYAYDPRAQSVKWQFPGGFSSWSPPSIGPDGTVYVVGVSEGGTLYALNGATGAVKWEQFGYLAVSPLVTADNRIIAVALGGGNEGIFSSRRVQGLNPANGDVLWTFTSDADIRTTPAGGSRSSGEAPQDTAYVIDRNGMLYALNAFDGTEEWRQDIGGRTDYFSSPVVGENHRVYAVSPIGDVYCYNSQGTLIWEREETGSHDGSTPAIGPDGTLYVVYNRKVQAYNGTTGATVWTFDAPSEATFGEGSPAVVSENRIYIGTSNGLMALNSQGGTFAWLYPTETTAISSPVVGQGGLVYFRAGGGNLYGLENQTGGGGAL